MLGGESVGEVEDKDFSVLAKTCKEWSRFHEGGILVSSLSSWFQYNRQLCNTNIETAFKTLLHAIFPVDCHYGYTYFTSSFASFL